MKGKEQEYDGGDDAMMTAHACSRWLGLKGLGTARLVRLYEMVVVLGGLACACVVCGAAWVVVSAWSVKSSPTSNNV